MRMGYVDRVWRYEGFTDDGRRHAGAYGRGVWTNQPLGIQRLSDGGEYRRWIYRRRNNNKDYSDIETSMGETRTYRDYKL